MTSQTRRAALALVRMETAKHLDEELVGFDEAQALVDIEEQLAELEEEDQLDHLHDGLNFAMQDVAALDADSACQRHTASPHVVSHNSSELVATVHMYARKSSSYEAKFASSPTFCCKVLLRNTHGASIGKQGKRKPWIGNLSSIWRTLENREGRPARRFGDAGPASPQPSQGTYLDPANTSKSSGMLCRELSNLYHAAGARQR